MFKRILWKVGGRRLALGTISLNSKYRDAQTRRGSGKCGGSGLGKRKVVSREGAEARSGVEF
jgi:hypothetical protein